LLQTENDEEALLADTRVSRALVLGTPRAEHDLRGKKKKDRSGLCKRERLEVPLFEQSDIGCVPERTEVREKQEQGPADPQGVDFFTFGKPSIEGAASEVPGSELVSLAEPPDSRFRQGLRKEQRTKVPYDATIEISWDQGRDVLAFLEWVAGENAWAEPTRPLPTSRVAAAHLLLKITQSLLTDPKKALPGTIEIGDQQDDRRENQNQCELCDEVLALAQSMIEADHEQRNQSHEEDREPDIHRNAIEDGYDA
jgi:hypothetical protein